MSVTTHFPTLPSTKTVYSKVQKDGCYYTNHWSVIYKVVQAFKNFLINNTDLRGIGISGFYI